MEKLEASVRESIKKMNTEVLRTKLGQAGVDEVTVAGMSREQLLNAWAEHVAEGREVPHPAATAPVKVPGYDVELERQRLAFEMKKFEEEMAWRREQEARAAAERAAEREERLAREAKLADERAAEKAERVAREAIERADRLALQKLHEKEVLLQQDQLDRQKRRDEWERENKKAPAAQAKFYGDVLKNVMPIFPTDVADAPIFFEGVEKLFESFEVPAELRAKLLLPYLNDKAKSLLLRLDKVKQDKYDEVKKFLLREFKLTPVQFKNRFDFATRHHDETYVMFCTRLKNLLTYYCESRKVDKSFETFFSLCVADKIKSTLSEACLDHVLTAENEKWLQCDDLADTIDTYLANHTYEGKPKSFRKHIDFAQANRTKVNMDVHSQRKVPGSNIQGVAINSTMNNARSAAEYNGEKYAHNVNGKNKGLCFVCQSPSHRQINCPSRNLQGSSAAGQQSSNPRTSVARNFACAVATHEPKVDVCRDAETTCASPDAVGATCGQSVKRDDQLEASGSAHSRRAFVGRPATNQTVKPEATRCAESTFHSAHAAIGDVDVTESSKLNMRSFSQLTYVPVCIEGIPNCQDALHDSGSQVNLIKRELLQQIPDMPAVGRISIKGIVGPAIETDLVSLNIKPAPQDIDCINIAPHATEIFAVCDELNEGIILTADAVKRLTTLSDYDSLIAVNQVTVNATDDPSSVESNAETDAQSSTTEITVPLSSHDKNDKQNNSTSDSVHTETDLTSADTVTLIKEQNEDVNLTKFFDMAKNGNKLFFIRDGILYRRGKVQGNRVEQLCLPENRIATVLQLAHDLPVSGHQAVRRTNDRIALSFFFPRQWQRVKHYCDSCNVCQLRARERRTDLVPIKPIERHEDNFGHLQADLIGPMGNGQYKYALVLTDVQSRYVTAFELSAPTAKNVVDKLLIHCSYFGLPKYISFDCGTHFTSELTQACLKRFGVSPRFHCPYNPRAAGLVERSNATLKQIISKLMAELPHSWHKILPFALWSIRTSVNETLGISPYQAILGQLAIGPLQLICDDWTGKRPLPLDLAKSPAQYLQQLEQKLQIAADYSTEHAAKEQGRYVHNYNLRSREKSFEVGERVIYLMPSSTHKLTRTWIGPCEIVRKNSPYSYVIEYDGKKQWCHANHLRRYNERVNQVVSNSCGIMFEVDQDFGDIQTLELEGKELNTHILRSSSIYDDCRVKDSVTQSNFDELLTETRDTLPSQKVKEIQLQHLTNLQRHELLSLLDEFSPCFSDKPGFCAYIEHTINVSPDFVPKRLKEYRIPEILKPEIRRQIDELLKNGFIRHSTSSMASPIVPVLKGPSGQGGVRLAIDFRYINSFCQGDALVLPNLLDAIQKVGASHYVTLVDARSGYWQLNVRERDRWLTAFIFEGSLYEWCRMPFGLKTAGNTFCRCVEVILQPIRDFSFSFVDDVTIGSESWTQHLIHLRQLFVELLKSGLTLSLEKCKFAQREIRFVGHIVGSGHHRPDDRKLESISDLSRPKTKKDIRKMLGFFNHFHPYIPHLAERNARFTSKLAKGQPNYVEWTPEDDVAFARLKAALCDSVKHNLFTAKWGQPFGIYCDASHGAVGSELVQWNADGEEVPISFASSKLSGAQLSWAAVEKEAYAVIWALKKFRTWIFGSHITIFSDSNPLTFLTSSAPKSAKLTRWAIALQQFDITFKHTRGKDNIIADYLSRPL